MTAGTHDAAVSRLRGAIEGIDSLIPAAADSVAQATANLEAAKRKLNTLQDERDSLAESLGVLERISRNAPVIGRQP